MTKPKLIEALEDLATYLTLASTGADKVQYKESRLDSSGRLASYHEGRSKAYNNAFQKLHRIIKEAKE